MKTWMAAWTIGAALASAANAAAQEPQPRLAVTARVDLYVNLPADELAQAEAYAAGVYRIAALDLIWLPAIAPASPAATAASPEAYDVRVVILPSDMSEQYCRQQALTDTVMGVALSGATQARSRIAYIFYDRIKRVALAGHTPVERGIGHVMAHEIGHLLLGVHSHSARGLMQPDWDPRDRQVQTFTVNQVQTIRERFSTSGN